MSAWVQQQTIDLDLVSGGSIDLYNQQRYLTQVGMWSSFLFCLIAK